MALSSNKKREKEILDYIKSESKKRKWQFRGWQSFKIEEPFLITVSFKPWGKDNSLKAHLNFKPKDLDNLHCEITGEEDYFKNGPLYYKVNSFGMVRPYNYYEWEVNDVRENKINNLLNEIDIKTAKLVCDLSDLEKHYEFVKAKREKQTQFAENQYLTTLIYLKKYDELMARIKTFKENNNGLSMVTIHLNNPELDKKSFYDKLIDYVDKQHS
ncbi:MAG: hypothetical protein RSF34_18520 [Flavobacterium sp.]|uniref:hypothetical protein n=1 Tax=Flavobacterium sp. TaxID=239 RepID=UPI002FCACDA0